MHQIFASVTRDMLHALDLFGWIAELPETPSFHVQGETISPTDWVTISAAFPAEGPYAIRPTEALKRSMAQPGSFLESWTKFKLDLASMPSVTAKTGRQQKPVQEVGGPVSLLSMAMPVKHIALTMEAFQGILATACPQAAPLAPQLSKVAASEFVYLWAMGANTEFIGVDFNAFGMVRMQLEGHRTLMCFCAEAVCDVLSLGSTATVDDILGSMKKKLKKDVIQALCARKAAYRMAVQPHTIVVMPEGWIVAERTGACQAMGIKRMVMPGTEEAISTVRSWAARRENHQNQNVILNALIGVAQACMTNAQPVT